MKKSFGAGLASSLAVMVFSATGEAQQAPVPAWPAGATPSGMECNPECSDGLVCNQGQCVSPPPQETAPAAPPVAEGAPSTSPDGADKTEPPAVHPYDKLRVGVGGGFGAGGAPDGSGFAIQLAVALGLPLGKHFYVRPEVGATYFATRKNDEFFVGGVGNQFMLTTRESDHLLVALRPLFGYQLSTLLSVRAGPLVGFRTMSVEQGRCGPNPAEKSFGGGAFGGSGAFAFHGSHVDFAVAFDAYSAPTQGLCQTSTNAGGVTTGAIAERTKLGTQLTVLGTYLF